MLCRILYLFTVYFPLTIRDLFISFLSLFAERNLVIDTLNKIFKDKGLIGVLPDGNLLFYPIDDVKLLSIISEIYQKRIYDVGQMKNFYCICDIGAHIGLFTLKISKEAPYSKIIAIEPNPVNFKFLLQNIAINGLKERVYALNVAVGQRKGKAILLSNTISRGDCSIIKWPYSRISEKLIVNVMSLDDILYKCRKVDFIKIDVEGAEYEVLRGLEKEYKKVDKMILEIHLSIISLPKIYKWLCYHGFGIIKRQKLYNNCLLLEAMRVHFNSLNNKDG